jgi:hypothetical protein
MMIDEAQKNGEKLLKSCPKLKKLLPKIPKLKTLLALSQRYY